MERMQPDSAAPMGFVGIGDRQEVTPHRQEVARSEARKAFDFAVKSETHLWTVVMSHRASDALLDAVEGLTPDSMPLLDTDTLLDPPSVGCMVCEQPYEPRLRRRKCPGEPS